MAKDSTLNSGIRSIAAFELMNLIVMSVGHIGHSDNVKNSVLWTTLLFISHFLICKPLFLISFVGQLSLHSVRAIYIKYFGRWTSISCQASIPCLLIAYFQSVLVRQSQPATTPIKREFVTLDTIFHSSCIIRSDLKRCFRRRQSPHSARQTVNQFCISAPSRKTGFILRARVTNDMSIVLFQMN